MVNFTHWLGQLNDPKNGLNGITPHLGQINLVCVLSYDPAAWLRLGYPIFLTVLNMKSELINCLQSLIILLWSSCLDDRFVHCTKKINKQVRFKTFISIHNVAQKKSRCKCTM